MDDHAFKASATSPKFEPVIIDLQKAQQRIKTNSVIMRFALAFLAKTEQEIIAGITTDDEAALGTIEDLSSCLAWLGAAKETVTAARARLMYCLGDRAGVSVEDDRPEPHPDQALFDACDHWRVCHNATEAASDDMPGAELDQIAERECAALQAVVNQSATTPEGLQARAQVIVEDHFNDLLNEKYVGERLLKLTILELIAIHGPSAPARPISHPDQAIFDACAVWRVKYAAFLAAQGDEELNRTGDEAHRALVALTNIPATTSKGLAAKAEVILADKISDPLSHLNDSYASERLVISVIHELVGNHKPASPEAAQHPDQALLDLCARCLDALASDEAIFAKQSTAHMTAKEAWPIEEKREAESSALWKDEIDPLLVEIGKTPALTMVGYAAKARIFLSDHLQFAGAEHMETACAQMLEDMAKLAVPAPEANREAA